MDLADRPMVAHVVDALSTVADDITVSVGGGCAPAYHGALGTRVRTVEDRATGRGPLEGLCNAFAVPGETYVAVVPCDVPLLRPEVLRLLAEVAVGRDGAVPVVRGYLEPLVAVYERDAGLRSFSEELDTGRGKVTNALARMDVERVEEDDLREVDGQLQSFWNINSKEDLIKVEEMVRQRSRRR